MALRIWSDEFQEGGFLSTAHEADSHGGTGQNQSPALFWDGIPAGTKSLALTVYDPDAPTGSGFWHWVVINLPPTLMSLPHNAGAAQGGALPPGAVQMHNDYGPQGFGGTAPPKGDDPHRYIFSIHALSTDALPLQASATNAVARFMAFAHLIESASITGYYQIK